MTLNIFNFEKNGKICSKLDESTVPVILKRKCQIRNTVISDLEPWRQWWKKYLFFARNPYCDLFVYSLL
jgi:hypothetical protein